MASPAVQARADPLGSRLDRGYSSARLRGQLPLSLLVTSSIVVLPGALAGVAIPTGGLPATAGATALAMVFSLALASVEAAAWKRWRRSGDLVFADLMLWSWAHRTWSERRLRSLRASFERALRSGAPVRIELLEGLSRLLEARSAYTHGHCRRVARSAERIARAMRLPPEEVARIRTAAVVHDLGKIYIPPAILDKTGPLTDEEYEVVKRHAPDGADMLESVRDRALAEIVRYHHERLDGSGYPDGLLGEEIPVGARIVAVADTFDAITSDRPYRSAMNHRQGMQVLRGEAGVRLDSEAVAAFLQRYSTRRSTAALSLFAALSARALLALRPAAGTLAASGASVAQLVPALGAAGLLALASAPHGAHRSSTAQDRSALSIGSTRSISIAGGRRSGLGGRRASAPHRAASPSGGPQQRSVAHAGNPRRPTSTTHMRTVGGSHRSAPATGAGSTGQNAGQTQPTGTSGSPSGSPPPTPPPSKEGAVEKTVKTVTEAAPSLSPPPQVTVPTATVPLPNPSLPSPPVGK